MTRKQIDSLLATHRAQRDFALKYLKENFDKLEANNQETEWVRRVIKHKSAVEQIEREKPDDE